MDEKTELTIVTVGKNVENININPVTNTVTNMGTILVTTPGCHGKCDRKEKIILRQQF